MLNRMANLHRAGVGAQQVRCCAAATLHIKGVMHRSRRMILRRIECREVKPVGLDFRPVSDIKTHRTKNRLDPLQGERHRVQAAMPAPAPRQAHIQCFGLQLCQQLGISQSLSAGVERTFDRLLGKVDGRTTGFFLIDAQCRQLFHQACDVAGFA